MVEDYQARDSIPILETIAREEEDGYKGRQAYGRSWPRRKKIMVLFGVGFIGLLILILCIALSSTSTSEDKDNATSSIQSDETLSYRDTQFNWKDPNEWQWADNSPLSAQDSQALFRDDHIVVNTKRRATPFRTRTGWKGSKVVYVEWISDDQSDTNIWMLNVKIEPQFGANNGWPKLGELDLFEMFNADAKLNPNFDYAGFREFKSARDYGQLTFHFGESMEQKCFCPASHTRERWYQDAAPLTTACSAQFQHRPNRLNRLATIFGRTIDGFYIQLIQDPVISRGADGTFDIASGPKSITTPRIWNNDEFFWGVPVGQCTGGHDPESGFPFFEEFRLIVEEQNPGGTFTVQDIKVLIPV